MTDRRGSVQFDGEEDENLNIDLADESVQARLRAATKRPSNWFDLI
jgi:hypothetical protein